MLMLLVGLHIYHVDLLVLVTRDTAKSNQWNVWPNVFIFLIYCNSRSVIHLNFRLFKIKKKLSINNHFRSLGLTSYYTI